MRVVVVTTSYPRSESDPSGHFVRSSARRLAHDGHEVHVVAPGPSPFHPPHTDGPLTIHRAGGGELFAWPGAVARATDAPWRLAALAPFAAGVHARLRHIGSWDRGVAHWILPSAFPLLHAFRGCELEATGHGGDVRLLLAAPRPVREHVVGALLARGARFTFAASSLRDALVASLRPRLEDALRRASRVEPPAIDVEVTPAAVAASRGAAVLAPGEALWVVAARLVASKRVELAIVAAALAKAKLVVLGDGPERGALQVLAGGLGANVTFLGVVPRPQALAWIAAADVLVHPSAVEAAPSVVREARALGVRVVACAAGDTTAWAAADAGIAIAEPTAQALASAALAQRAACIFVHLN